MLRFVPLLIAGALWICTSWISTPALAQTDKPGFGPPPVAKRTTPKILIEETTHNWGKIMQGEKHRHAFPVKNNGSGPLRINNVKSSCGCTTVDWPKVLEPGATGEIVLEIDTTRLRQSHVKKYATVTSNDPSTPQTKIYIEGDLIQIIDHEPKVISLAGLNGTLLESTVILKPGSDVPIEVTSVKPRSRHVEVVQVKELEKGQRYEVLLRATPQQRPAMLRDTLEVTVMAADGKVRNASLIVNIEHKDRIQVQPRGNVVFQRKDTMRLMNNPDAAPIVRPVMISAGGPDVSFEIQEVLLQGVPEGLFDFEITTLQPGKRFKISLRCLKHFDQRFARGNMIIKTNDPAAPERSVRIFAQFGSVAAAPPVRGRNTSGATRGSGGVIKGPNGKTLKMPPKQDPNKRPTKATGPAVKGSGE